MNPNDPTTPTPPENAASAGFSSSSMDIPPLPEQPVSAPAQAPLQPVTPIAPVDPTPAATPVPMTSPVAPTTPPIAPQAPVSPPPAMQPMPATPAVGQSTFVTPKQGGFPKKIVLFVVAILLLAMGVFLLLKVVLPRLQGGSSGATITWWGLWESPQIVQPLIDEYQASHPGVTIKYEQKAKEQYRERLANAVAQDQGPDIMTIHNSWVPMFRSSLSPMPSSVFTPQEYQQTFYPVMTADMTQGSNLVGIPTEYDGLGLYVNDEIFSTYALPIPTTWNDVRDTAIALTIRDDKGVIKQSGIAMGSTKNVDHWQEILGLLMFQNGAKLENPTGDLAEGALSFFTVFSTKDGVWNDTLPNSTTMFASGKLAMMVAPSWRAHDILAVSPSLKFRVLPVPQLPKNTPDEPDITYATYWVSAVSAKSKVEAQSWEFMKFLSTKESYQKLFDNAAQVRAFGEPYPRVDMRETIAADPKLGGILSLAGNAKSWYLAGRTFDGETGINSRIGKYFEDAVNAAVERSGDVKGPLTIAAQGVLQVLVDYGLATAPPPVK